MRLTLFFLIVSFHAVLGQSSNPFDIEERITQTELDTTVSYEDFQQEKEEKAEQLTNPFELRGERSKSEPSRKSVISLSGENNNKNQPTGIFHVLYALLCTAMLSLGIILNRDRFYSIVNSTTNTNELKTLIRGGRLWTDIQAYMLYSLFFLNAAMFVYLAISLGLLGVTVQSRWLLLFILVIITGIYIGRHLFLWLLEYVFPLGQGIEFYNHSVALHNITAGCLLLPIVLGLQFGPDFAISTFFIGGMVVLAGIYLLRQAKGLFLAIGSRGFNPIYFFIYLCAVELAPMLIGLRLVKEFM